MDIIFFQKIELFTVLGAAIFCSLITNSFNFKLIQHSNENKQEAGEEYSQITTIGYYVIYTLIILIFLSSFTAVFYHLNQAFDVNLMLYLAVTFMLIFIMVINAQKCPTPNIIQYILAILATSIILIENNLNSDIVMKNAGSGVLYMCFSLIPLVLIHFKYRTDTIGVENVKFCFIIGFLLGIHSFATFVLLTGIIGIIMSFIWQKIIGKTDSPLTQTICISTFLCLLYNDHLNPVELLESLIFLGL